MSINSKVSEKSVLLCRAVKVLRIRTGRKLATREASDQNNFTTGKTTKLYPKSYKDVPEQVRIIMRIQNPSMVIVWSGVSYHGVTELHFCEPKSKINVPYYIGHILGSIVKLQSETLSRYLQWVFQQGLGVVAQDEKKPKEASIVRIGHPRVQT